MLLILRHQAQVDFFLKQNIIFANKILKKRLKMLIRRYLILVEWLKRLITILKLQKNEIPSCTGLVTITALNRKVIEIEGKLPDITNLATKVNLAIINADINTK